MPGIPHPSVLRVRQLLKDSPVKVRRMGSRGVTGPYLDITTKDECTFGPELSQRLNDVLRPDADHRPYPTSLRLIVRCTDFKDY